MIPWEPGATATLSRLTRVPNIVGPPIEEGVDPHPHMDRPPPPGSRFDRDPLPTQARKNPTVSARLSKPNQNIAPWDARASNGDMVW